MRLPFLSISALAALLFTTLVTTAGCGLFGDDEGGRVIVRLTDAPIDADAITVSLVSFTVIDSETGDRETVPLNPEAEGINLLDYQDGLTLLIADNTVSIGHLDQFRLQVGEDPTITIAGEEHDLHIASGSSSGIKFFLDERVELNGGDTFDVTLDFDAQASVVATGPPSAPTGYVMTPVIRPVTAMLNDVELSISDGEAERASMP